MTEFEGLLNGYSQSRILFYSRSKHDEIQHLGKWNFVILISYRQHSLLYD